MDSSTPQSLHDKMQAIYDRSQMATSLKNCLPVTAEFAQELFNNSFFEEELQNIRESQRIDLTPMLDLKTSSYKEISATRELLASHEQKIPALSIYLQECNDLEKKRLPMSWELLFDLEAVLRRVCVFLKVSMRWLNSNDHYWKLLKLLAIVDEKGNITKHIFAPSLQQWHIENALFERTKKTALWYSTHILAQIHDFYYLKNRALKYHSLISTNQHSAAYFFEVDFHQFDQALESKASSDSLLKFDVEEYKMHLHRVWTAIKPKLMAADGNSNKNGTLFYRYSKSNDLRKGILNKGKVTQELVGNSAEVLYLALKKKNLSSDEAGEELPDNTTPKKGQVTSALRVIRNNVLQKFGLAKYISSKSGTISVNYPTHLIK